MKLIAAFGALLIVSSVQANDKGIIRDKSPDGKFALRFTKDDQGMWDAAIVDLKSKEAIESLELYQNMVEGARLVWSKDSQRVAYFEPDRRGGSTHVYFREDDEFDDVDLPDLPECKRSTPKEGESHAKTVEETTAPEKWLGSGALVLKVQTEELMEKNDKQFSEPCTQIITVAFDADEHASIESVKQSK